MFTHQGKNWCRKYDREIDDELVHKICEVMHPKGCANCDQIYYKKTDKFTELLNNPKELMKLYDHQPTLVLYYSDCFEKEKVK